VVNLESRKSLSVIEEYSLKSLCLRRQRTPCNDLKAQAFPCYTSTMDEKPPVGKSGRVPLPQNKADPESVQKALDRVKRLLAPSPEELKEMPVTSKQIQ
jgi:hypothetical protein